MKIDRRRLVLRLPLAAAAGAWAASAASQPADKVVRIVVPLPAGGSSDALARLLADKLRGRYAAALVIDNRAGGGGRIGVQAVKGGDSDGSLLLFTPDFPITLFPGLYKKLPYAPADFVPVAACGVTAFALAAGPGLPDSVTSLGEFVQWCKANPARAAFASPSAGSTPHFAGMMFARAAGVEIQHVAYKGGAPAIQDLLGGQIPVSINPIGEVLPHVAARKLRMLATTGAQRSRFTPDVPTFVEAGYKDVVVESWLGFLAPSATPRDVVARLADAIQQVLRSGEVTEAFGRIGFELAAAETPADFGRRVEADVARWTAVVKASGFTPEE